MADFSLSLFHALNSLEEFGDTASASLTLSEFQSIELEGEADPPAFQRAQVSFRRLLMK